MDKTISGVLLKEVTALGLEVYDDQKKDLFKQFKDRQKKENKEDTTFSITLSNENVAENEV